MTVGFVLDDGLDKPDGVQQYILTLGDWLVAHGHEVHYLVGQTTKPPRPNVHSLSKNMNIRFNRNALSIPYYVDRKRIRTLLAAIHFDVLHIQLPHSPQLAGSVIAAAKPQTAIVGTFHILPFSRKEQLGTKLLSHLLRGSLRQFDAVTAVSEPAAQFAQKTLGLKSQVVPNPINMAKFKTKQKFRSDNKTNTIVFLGRLVERKGCRYLLKAINYLHRQNRLSNTRVIIVGDGPLRNELEIYVKKHSLGDVVQFAGFVQEADKAGCLASADIAVFPSLGGESFGIVLIEAMAAGAGVVLAGDNPGYASVMFRRKEQLIDPKNTKEFAERIDQFLSVEEKRHKAHAWQQTHVRQFDITVIGPRVEGIYKTAIAKRRGLPL